MNIYLVQEFSREDYDFSTDIKHHGLYVNRDEAIVRAKQVFENLKEQYAKEIDKYTYKEDEDNYHFDEDGEAEFYIDDDKGRYEFHFGSEEDFELFSVTVEEVEFGNEAYVVHRKCKKELLIEDIKSKAIEMDIDLTGKDISVIADRVQNGLDNNDGFWECYWLSLEYELAEI